MEGHTILKVLSRNDHNNNNNEEEEDDSVLLEPIMEDDDDDNDNDPNHASSWNRRVVRVPCYPPLLQRMVEYRYQHRRHPQHDGRLLAAAAATTTTMSSSSPENCHPPWIVEVPLQELIEWDSIRGYDLALRITQNTLRYASLFASVLDQRIAAMEEQQQQQQQQQQQRNLSRGSHPHLQDEQHPHDHPMDVMDTLDVLRQQRLEQQRQRQQQRQQQQQQQQENLDVAGGGILHDDHQQQQQQQRGTAGGATEDFPPLLMRRYELRILPMGRRGMHYPFHQQYIKQHQKQHQPPKGLSLRHVRSKSMGKLVTIHGMVVRSSDVKPSCQVATYSCDACGCEVYQVLEGQREFLPQRDCPSEECQQGRARRETLLLQTRGSKFVKFQELKLQELPSQVPMGHVPRSMSVYCRGELTRLANPGDVVTMDGIFLPQRVSESGSYRARRGAGLITTLFLEAQHILVHKKSYEESLMDTLSEEERAKMDADVLDIAMSEDPIGRLSASIAPEIFGHEDIKRSLLLQLVGGCTRKLPDGMRIRGDINICLMGDPGVAKSQLLKHVASVAPRGVYTTGKGSSGVGLTAAITKDTMTGEMSLEGGALVLADRGICAIDEFDK